MITFKEYPDDTDTEYDDLIIKPTKKDDTGRDKSKEEIGMRHPTWKIAAAFRPKIET